MRQPRKDGHVRSDSESERAAARPNFRAHGLSRQGRPWAIALLRRAGLTNGTPAPQLLVIGRGRVRRRAAPRPSSALIEINAISLTKSQYYFPPCHVGCFRDKSQ